MPGTHFCFFTKTSLPAGGRFHMEPRIFCDKRLVRVFTSFTRATPICSSRNGMLRRWKRSLGIKAWFAVFLLFQILHHDSAGCPTHWDVATKAWFAALLLFQIPHHDPASSPTHRDIVTKAWFAVLLLPQSCPTALCQITVLFSYAGKHHENSAPSL